MWAEIERGTGARLHWRALQIGDPRCNRTAYGAWAGDRYVPLLDEDDAADARALQTFVTTLGRHGLRDAAVVAPAWAHLQAGTTPVNPAELEAWERLQACSYAIAHPDTGELVPACAQHGVLDPGENERLVRQLPRA